VIIACKQNTEIPP